MSDATHHGPAPGQAVPRASGEDRLARWNVGVLSLAQALYGINAMVVITLGGIAGHTIADDKSLATLPISLMLLGTALSTAPWSMLMQRFGRRTGFLLGAGCGMAGMLVATYAVIVRDFWLLCLGTHMCGYYQASAQYYRFAAADTASSRFAPRAISLVMAGGIAAAFVAPAAITYTKDMLAPAFYAGSFLLTAGMSLVAFCILALTRIPTPSTVAGDQSGARPLSQIFAEPRLLAAVGAGAVSYGIMSLLMTATPLAMVACSHSVDEASTTVSWHVVAMYAPSFFTGSIIARFGRERVVGAGLCLLVACAAIAMSGISLSHFTIALVLLGLGWNFAFIGATTMVTESHRPQEAGKVQAVNDLVVFGFVAFSSFMSGKLLEWVGWQGVNMVVLPAVMLALALIVFLARRPPAESPFTPRV